MYLKAGVLLEDLGLTWNNKDIEVFNSVGLYVVPESALNNKYGVVTEWYLDKNEEYVKTIFFDKVSRLPEIYQQRFPDEFYIYDYDTDKVKFYTGNVLIIDDYIAKLLIPWRR